MKNRFTQSTLSVEIRHISSEFAKTVIKLNFSRYPDDSICPDCKHKCVHYAKMFLKTCLVLSKCYSILEPTATGAQRQDVPTYWVALGSVQCAFTISQK